MFDEYWQAFVTFCYSCLLTLKDIITDVFYFLFDSILGLILFILDSITFIGSSFDVVAHMSAIPPETQAVMHEAGVNEGVAMVTAALGVRILLQLIPFTRLGS